MANEYPTINESWAKQVKKEYGDVLISASTILETPKKIVSVSPSLDIALKGGLVEGTWVQLSGAKKCGKTTLALHIAGKAQKMDKLVLYVNAEGRLKELNLRGVKGLDIDKLKVITSQEGTILTAEQYLTATANFIKMHPGAVVILDSVSALCSDDEMTSVIAKDRRPAGPKLLAQFFRQLGQVVPIQKTIVIMIHHLMTQQGVMTHGKIEDGGEKAQYQSDTKLRCKYTEAWKNTEKEIGHKIHWDLVWSALGSPMDEVVSYLKYGEGIDEVMELFFIAADFGLISQAGAWYKMDFLENQSEYIDPSKPIPKFQGQDNACEYLRQYEGITEFLSREIRKISV